MLEKIIEALKSCEPDKALIYAEKAVAFAKEQCGNSVPSGEHGYLEELAGLLQVTRMQRDQADRRYRKPNQTIKKCGNRQ